MNPYFFGYGSLVNRRTQNYPDGQPATLKGWQRVWVPTGNRQVVLLSVQAAAQCQIDGLIAAVPNADWAALDLRETGYHRENSGQSVQHKMSTSPEIAHYRVPETSAVPLDNHFILLSYLDVVVQGFLHEFGPEGVTRFFETTVGWQTPIFNDRATPEYPRHQRPFLWFPVSV